MATESYSQAVNHSWMPLTSDLPPTSLADSTVSPNRDTPAPIRTMGDGLSGRIGESGTDRPASRPTPTSTSEAVISGRPASLPHGEDASVVNHAKHSPIPIPQAVSTVSFDQMAEQDINGDTSTVELSPLEDFIRNRRPSISFLPTVTLESGHLRGLGEPLPRLVIKTQSRQESLLQEAKHPSRTPLQRAQSETDCRNYDTTTGEPVDIPSRRGSSSSLFSPDSRRPSYQHAHSTIDESREHRLSLDSEQGISLTSEATASSITSEIHTPTESMEILLSPVSAFLPLTFPISLENSSAWPKPRRQISGSRAKSYEVERGLSMRSAQRQGSRTSTRRSTTSPMSPAIAFLSKYARQESPPEPDSEGQEVGEYVLGKQVGYGGFSTVREAFTLEGDERICRAVKVVRRQVPGKGELENDRLQAEFEHEVSLWRCLGHRNILPLIEVYETNFATFCFTKLNTGGTLFDVVRANRQGIDRDLARRYAYQLASAIRYLHEDVRVVHRDIKLENCLIDVSDPEAAKDGGNVLLCDFGLAEFVTHDPVRGSPDPYDRAHDRPVLPPGHGPSELSTSIAGSLQYASPELIMSPAGFLSSVVDIWAFGVVMYALQAGDLPFQHTFQPRVQMMILAGEWNASALEQAPGVVGYEEEVLDMMRGCLDMDSEGRWTISQVLGCQWLSGCSEILEELNESIKL